MSRGGTAHLSDSPACNGAVIPCLFAFCMLPQSTCHKQADDMQTCQKPQKQSTHTHKKKENTLVLSSTTTGICNHIQSTQPTLIPFFFLPPPVHHQASPLATRSAGELQIQLHLAALSGCCKKLEPSILTLIRANEQRGHVLSKDPQTGANIHSSAQLRSWFFFFHRRTDSMHSIAMTKRLHSAYSV